MNKIVDRIKEVYEDFDPRLKKLIVGMFGIVILAVIVFGGEDSDVKVTQKEGQVEIKKIEEKRKSGSISRSSAKRSSSGVRSKMESSEESMKNKYANISDYTGLPDWAREAGIIEVTGLSLVDKKSLIIRSSEKHKDGFAAVYLGSSNSLIGEAKRIKEKLDLELVSSTKNSYAARGSVNGYSVVIAVSKGEENYQLKYGASK